MAKKRGAKRPTLKGPQLKDVQLEVQKLDISLNRIALRSVEYSEVEVEHTPLQAPPNTSIKADMHIEGRFLIYPGGLEVTVLAEVSPDRKHMPFTVKATVSGFFRRPDSLSDEHLLAFAKQSSLRLMYPYIREVVSSISSRGLFGTFWMDPLAIQLGEVKQAQQ